MADENIIRDPDSQIAVQMDPYEYHVVPGNIPCCCGSCEMNVQNVDIYYWPEPNVNTSCLSIIGDSVRPVDYGATRSVWTDGTETVNDTYWGCDAKTSTIYETDDRNHHTYTDGRDPTKPAIPIRPIIPYKAAAIAGTPGKRQVPSQIAILLKSALKALDMMKTQSHK